MIGWTVVEVREMPLACCGLNLNHPWCSTLSSTTLTCSHLRGVGHPATPVQFELFLTQIRKSETLARNYAVNRRILDSSS